jgi:hypothetical protein
MKLRSLLFALLLGLPFAAGAQNYSFNCVTNNLAADCATAVNQLHMTVSEASGGGVDFLFTNTGPNKSSITDVYFDWASTLYALTPGLITGSTGVSFSWGAAPPDLPGGTGIGFSANIAADSNSPSQPNGVNPGEWVNFNFAGSYSNLVAALDTDQLRVGIHVQGFLNGGSESLVVTPVPEPETYAMLLAGLFMMGFVIRRRRAGALQR